MNGPCHIRNQTCIWKKDEKYRFINIRLFSIQNPTYSKVSLFSKLSVFSTLVLHFSFASVVFSVGSIQVHEVVRHGHLRTLCQWVQHRGLEAEHSDLGSLRTVVFRNLKQNFENPQKTNGNPMGFEKKKVICWTNLFQPTKISPMPCPGRWSIQCLLWWSSLWPVYPQLGRVWSQLDIKPGDCKGYCNGCTATYFFCILPTLYFCRLFCGVFVLFVKTNFTKTTKLYSTVVSNSHFISTLHLIGQLVFCTINWMVLWIVKQLWRCSLLRNGMIWPTKMAMFDI